MIRRKLINFPKGSCDYRLGFGALDELGKFAKVPVGTPQRAVIVTVDELAEVPCVDVRRALVDAGFAVSDLALPAGPGVRSLAYAVELFDALDETALTADDLVVGVGDADLLALVQYCAHSWCGGTSSLLIPVTLDAMATVATSMRPLDTAHRSSQMVWMDTHPSMVVADLDFVRAASEEEKKPGYLELMSAALMDSRRSWDRFGEQLERMVSCEEIPLVDAITGAQTARLSAVKAANPSARSAPMYGVTTARALRACLGEDVPAYRLLAEGMRFEARLGVEAGKLAADDMFEQDDRLDALGIEELPFELAPERFIQALHETRFKRSNRFMFSLPQNVGTIRLTVVEDELLERHARAYLASRAELLEDFD